MNILFLHPNMPGQYKHLARALAATGQHRIFFITKHKTAEIPGVTRITYAMPKPAPDSKPHRYLLNGEAAIRQGQHVWRVANELKQKQNFIPDIVVTHPGWGDALFIKDLFPNTKLLSFCEFYYRATGADVGFDPAEPFSEDDLARVRVKNTTNLLNLEQMDWGIAPTVWQWSLHPEDFKPRISVLHDGIDVQTCAPDAAASLAVGAHIFRPGDEVITYIARNFEPYRGFPTFMRAAEIILRERPKAHIIAVGADDVSYGKRPQGELNYRQQWLEKVNLPAERIHFVGTLPHATLLDVFRISAAHIYLTYPFVLSWGMLEAMACGVPLVASRTAPVLEVVEEGVNGQLADFFSAEDVANKVFQLLDAKDANAAMRAAARATVVQRFALADLLPLHVRLVEEVAAGHIPPPVAQEIVRLSPVAPYSAAMWNA